MKGLPASTGWQWVLSGMVLFRRQPGLLTSLLVAYMLCAMLISQVPYAGTPLFLILLPSFSIALLQACAMIARGERAVAQVALTGFHQPAFQRLCRLGLVYLALFGVFYVLERVMISDELAALLAKPLDPQNPPAISTADLSTKLLLLLLQGLAMVSLSFATPLAYWKQMAPFKAAFYSFFAVARAWRAFLVMLLSLAGLFTGALMLMLLIFGRSQFAQAAVAWVILMAGLIQQCAIFAAYHQIFGAPEEPPAA